MRPANRTRNFGESTIREMTRLAIQHNAINLSQGFPDFDPPEAVLHAATGAILGGANQYTITWGHPALRQKLAEIYTRQLGWAVDPDQHITVTCGVTEGIAAAQMALLDPGDEIIILEPAHENFRPASIMVGAAPVAVPLEAPGYRLDPARIEAAITPRTRALLLNTPHNPTGRVFDDDEIAGVVELVLRHNLILFTDEIYDRILYDGRTHQSPGGLEALRDRTITVGGLGKSFAVTGWRLGYIISPASVAVAIRKIHDYMTICAPTPLQIAAAAALALPDSYYAEMTAAYHQRRDLMMGALEELGFVATLPQGAYYTMADYTQMDIPQAQWDSTRFAQWMTTEVGVAVVPGTSFYSLPGYGEQSIRFAFPKKLATLQAANERMMRMQNKGN
ncbi:MAG: pyridoxal phosphate-dependent aminotransferase [Caldilineaceae bacterium]|nr:pyridoxal phosphate-dependent aminotransferase [Caldilineaceae bacterium]